MIKHLKKFNNRASLLKEVGIAMAAMETMRIIAGTLIALGVIAFPGDASRPAEKKDTLTTFSRRVLKVSVLSDWTYVGRLIFVSLNGETKHSGKALIFIYKKLNAGYGYDFANSPDYQLNLKSGLAFPVYTSPIHQPTALNPTSPAGYDLAELRTAFGESNFPQENTAGKDPASYNPAIRAPELQKLLNGMTEDQVITRVKQDKDFRRQLRSAAEADGFQMLDASTLYQGALPPLSLLNN